MINKKIGEKIRQARVIANLSQENLAQELHISVGAYSNLERGKTEISVSRLLLISKLLKVPLSALLPESLVNKEVPGSIPTRSYTSESENNAQIVELRDQVNLLRKEVASMRKRVKK